MMKQQKMVSYFYKKIATILVIAFIFLSVSTSYAARIVWPSSMNLYNNSINFDELVPDDATASDSKKGFLFTGDANEVFYLGCGHIAINVALSGKGHTYIQYLKGFKERGMKITLILVNDRPTVGSIDKNAPPEFQNPYFYMIDFDAVNGEWQKYNFDRIVEDYSPYVDNWVIGNEINSQMYNYYGPAKITEYTKKYCDTFEIIYKQIKLFNKNANFFISFDQYWDMPDLREKDRHYNEALGKYKYNAKEQIDLINKYLDKSIEWGVALHPYATPLEEGMFWDDEYSGYDEKATDEKQRPYFLTAKNFEIALAYLNETKFLLKNKKQRKIIISELGFTSHDGEEIQAAGLYYIWKKIKRYDKYIDAFLYNAQTDLDDGLNLGLTGFDNRKRLAWLVFKNMDTEMEYNWCQDLLDKVLEKYGYYEYDLVFFELVKEDEKEKEKKSAIIKG